MTKRYWIYKNWRAGDHKALIHRVIRRSRRSVGVPGPNAGGSHGQAEGKMLSRAPMNSYTGAPTGSPGLSEWLFKPCWTRVEVLRLRIGGDRR